MIFWLYCAFPRLRFIQSAYESSLFSEELFFFVCLRYTIDYVAKFLLYFIFIVYYSFGFSNRRTKKERQNKPRVGYIIDVLVRYDYVLLLLTSHFYANRSSQRLL